MAILRVAAPLIACASILAGALAARAAQPARAASLVEAPDRVTAIDLPWRVLQISADQRTLVVLWPGAPCGTRLERVVTSARDTVRVRLRAINYFDAGDCQYGDPFLPGLRVRLPVPLLGRRLLGGSDALGYRWTPVRTVRGRRVPVAPRLLGLAPADAAQGASTALLRPRLVRAHRRGGRRRVIAQSPAPGRRVGAGQRIVLRVGGG